jgi:tRNA (guanine37-N1)-methyltransferase
MTFHFVTLFPGAFDSYLGESILKRAIEDKKISVKFYNPRDYSQTKWARVDNKPYGGGPGMVIEALPVIKAIAKARAACKGATKKTAPIIWLTPSGKQFDTETAQKFAGSIKTKGKKISTTELIIVCGRYEGIDARVKKVFKTVDLSVGPFVLTGGELPAMLIMDCVARQIPGVLGSFDSLEERRVSSADVYTRPETIVYKGKKLRVPKVLLSGNPKLIDAWKNSLK